MINIGAVISGRYEIIEKVGTGGMASKIAAAMIAANSGADMVITNANNVESNIRGAMNVGGIAGYFGSTDVNNEYKNDCNHKSITYFCFFIFIILLFGFL